MSRATDEQVLCEISGAVALLTLNRPERMNAWTREMELRYFDLLDRLDDDPEVRAIVVTGAGRGFCRGSTSRTCARPRRGRAASGRPRGRCRTGSRCASR